MDKNMWRAGILPISGVFLGNKNSNCGVLAFVALLGAAMFFMGVVDGLFFQPSSYAKAILGAELGREDIYYASLTIFFALVCAACALAMKIGAKQKPDAMRFFAFTAANLVLFSIWIWALGWMSISQTMASGINKPLDLWRFGPAVIWVNTFDFPAIIAASFVLHAALLYSSLKKNFLMAKE